MNEPTYTIKVTGDQVRMIQRSLRLATLMGDATFVLVDVDPLDIEHLRTHIAESVSNQEEQ